MSQYRCNNALEDAVCDVLPSYESITDRLHYVIKPWIAVLVCSSYFNASEVSGKDHKDVNLSILLRMTVII